MTSAERRSYGGVELGRVSAERIRAFGHCWDLEAVGRIGYVRLAPG